MRKFSMRTLLAWCCTFMLLLPVGLVGCSDYDDSQLWQDVNNLKERIAAIEKQVNALNDELALLQKAVDKMVYIAKVEQITDGYIITFTDASTLTIHNGKDGANAPVIGVKQDTDGVYYWTLTTDGKTDWLMVDGGKLRVTGESITPILGVDSEGYWTISYDGGTTSIRILDADKNPVSAVGNGGDVGSLFRGVTEDKDNVYFQMSNGTIITVAKRNDFYLLIRQAPEKATLVYGETQVYEVEAVGVMKTVITKPDEWHVVYANNKLSITAPTKAHSTCCDTEGTVSIIYFSANGQSDVATMDVVVDKDYTGETVGDNFTVNITEITDKSAKFTVTPKNTTTFWYAVAYDKAKYDTNGEAAYLTEQMGMFSYYVQNEYMWGYLDAMLHQGTATVNSAQLKPGSELYVAVFGLEVNKQAGTCAATTTVMTVPFKTKQAVVINTVYRINVSDISWYGAKYVTVPSDNLGYFHGFVTKTEFEKSADDAAFMQSIVTKYRDTYNDELYVDYTMKWSDLTYTGTQTIVSPGIDPKTQNSVRALSQDTDYYVYSFASADANVTSPLSKASFKTGKFVASEEGTFEVTTAVERQDVTVSVVASNKNINYICSLYEASYYDGFSNALQYAADDLFWTKLDAQNKGVAFASYLWKGNESYTFKNRMAATAYVACVYGCTVDGVITTAPVVVRVLTKGTVDGTSAGFNVRCAKDFIVKK